MSGFFKQTTPASTSTLNPNVSPYSWTGAESQSISQIIGYVNEAKGYADDASVSAQLAKESENTIQVYVNEAEQWAVAAEGAYQNSKLEADRSEQYATESVSIYNAFLNVAANQRIVETFQLSENQTDVVFTQIFADAAFISISGQRIDGSYLLKDLDYTITGVSEIQLKRSYPFGTVLVAFQDIQKDEDPSGGAGESFYVWNRKVVNPLVGVSYQNYAENGRILTPRVSFEGYQYLPLFDSTEESVFTGVPVKNVDGTLTIPSDKGDRSFSKVVAEAIARGEVGDLEFTVPDTTTARKIKDRFGDRLNVKDFGAVADGITDDTVAIQRAIDAVPAFGTLEFTGKFRFEIVNVPRPMKFVGDAEMTFTSIRIKTSHFTSALSGRLIAKQYSTATRAFQVKAYEDEQDYENIRILYNNFEGWFYCTDFRGRGYAVAPDDPTNRVLKNTLILGCTSTAPTGLNAGHYQHTGVTNAKCIGCSAYKGQNATSYNFINGNGHIVVAGCYDENNSYGSLEIENNQFTSGSVTGNSFGHDLWIDDTSNINVTGNSVKRIIRITSQSNDTGNINITGNTAASISVTRFGENPTGRLRNILISSNMLIGGIGGLHGVFCDSAVSSATIQGNVFAKVFTNAVALVRSVDCAFEVKNNVGNVPIITSSTGGVVKAYGNVGIVYQGSDNESAHIDTMTQGSTKDFLDLPGKYLHGSKYLGDVGPGVTKSTSLSIPDSGALAFRGVSIWVLIRDVGSNNTSSYRIDGIYKVVGNAIALSLGQPYSPVGIDTGIVTISQGVVTSNAIGVSATNTGAKNLQITLVPEVSSRFGTNA